LITWYAMNSSSLMNANQYEYTNPPALSNDKLMRMMMMMKTQPSSPYHHPLLSR